MSLDHMRDRTIYRVFHSTDEEAPDILLDRWKEEMQSRYPEGTITDAVIEDARIQAEDTVAAVRDNSGYFVIAPSGELRIVSPVEVASDWEDYDGGNGDLFGEIQNERHRQIEEFGYTPEHDDEHGGDHLLDIARSFLVSPSDTVSGQEVRANTIKALATLVALVELIDRAEQENIAQIVEQAVQEDPSA